ncbi:MAG: hypothetical protein OXC48_03960 [Endozoicomonadaceae bacterium]|nr:hypothetical protein [Endozoicomonadaceae bacterium]
MSGSKKLWVLNLPKPKASPSVKSALQEKADKFIDNVLKPKHLKPAPTDNNFNYLSEIFSKWNRNYFYICGKYNCPGPRAISPSFETKFARMEYTHGGKYNLSYMRHTGRWFEICQNIDEDECLKLIANDSLFIPS